MPRIDYVNCRQCERHTSECGPLSHIRLCLNCGLDNCVTNLVELKEHRGPAFLRYRRALAASVGAVLIEPTRS